MSDTLKFNPDDLTVNDLVDFEEVTGKDLFEFLPADDEAAEDFAPSMKDMRALVWIIRRKQQPDLTLEQAGDVKITQLDIGESEAPKTRPTKRAGSKN